MTIHDCAAQLRQESNAQGGSRLLLWAADTLEAMHKALAEAEWDNGECKHCKHRGEIDACPDIVKLDFDCHKCEHPCRCWLCREGRNWEWRCER